MNVSLSNWVKIQSGFYYSVSYKTCFYNQSWTELLDNSYLFQIFFFFSFTVVHTISPVTLLYVQNNPDGIHFLLYICRTWEQKVIIAVVSGTTCLLIAGCSCMFSIVVDIKLTWAERGSSTSAVRVTLYSAVTLFSLLHNSCWPLSLRKPP